MSKTPLPSSEREAPAPADFEIDWPLIALLKDASAWPQDAPLLAPSLSALSARMKIVVKDMRPATFDLSASLKRDGGVALLVLKVHQMLARLMTCELDPPLLETVSLLLAANKSCPPLQDYQDDYPSEAYNSTDSTNSTRLGETRKALDTPLPDLPVDIDCNQQTRHDNDTPYPPLFVTLSKGAWKDVSAEEGEALLSSFCLKHGDVGTNLIMDAEYVSMAVTSSGRFDTYLLALMAMSLKQVEAVYSLGPSPLLANCWLMAQTRAAHGLRVLRDATETYQMTQSKYEWYVTLLTSGSLRAVQDTFHDLANEIWHAQFSRSDVESGKKLETLLVALLGHRNDMVRSQAAVFLNNFYDQHDWQQNVPFLPTIKCVGDLFEIEITINDVADPKLGQTPTGVFLLLASPSISPESPYESYRYFHFQWSPSGQQERHKSHLFRAPGEAHSVPWTGVCRLGTFWRCGYYDWRVVRCEAEVGSWSVVQCTINELSDRYRDSFSFIHLGDSNKDEEDFSFRRKNLWPELAKLADIRERVGAMQDEHAPFRTLPLQGRFIVQPKDMRKHQFHEIFVDQQGARESPEERGSFAKVGAAVGPLKSDGISALYLSGCLSRDNGEVRYLPNGAEVYERPEASPYAVPCRATPCSVLGGARGFSEMMKSFERHGMKVIVDSLCRVSSSRSHRKYWPHILYSIDDQGKRIMLYGSDGRSMDFEESCMLNYRQVESWDLMVSDIIAWQSRHGVHGVKLDNVHLIPQIMQADEDELNRLDPDGRPHYTPEEQLRGDIVLPCSDHKCGFWSSTAAKSHWPNPMLVRLCRDLWRVAPDFMLIGDCAMMDNGAEKRIGCIARSGVVPQMHSLPRILCGLFGKRIDDCGTVRSVAGKKAASVLNGWFEASHESLPEGAISVLSSCSQSSPLPGLLYGRGAWPATDLLFFSSDIPSTSMGEIEGFTLRLGVANVFKAQPSTGQPLHTQMSTAKSLLNIEDATASNPNSCNTSPSTSPPSANSRGAIFSRARSLTKFEPIAELDALEQAHAKQIGPEFGFDIKKIPAHYRHRRSLRRAFDIFSEGVMFPLRAVDKSGVLVASVFSFCRFDMSRSNLLIGAINFSDNPSTEVSVSVRFLSSHLHTKGVSSSSIIEKWDLFSCENDYDGKHSATVKAVEGLDFTSIHQGKTTLMSLTEALAEPHTFTLEPCASSCYGIKLLDNGEDEAVCTALFVSSLMRLEKVTVQIAAEREKTGEVSVALQRALKANHVGAALKNAICIPGDLTELGRVLLNVGRASAWQSAATGPVKIAPPSFPQLLIDSGLMGQESPEVAVKLFAKLDKIIEGLDVSTHEDLFELCDEIRKGNSLGPVVFMTVELGKWSVVGGLGVMVDELSVTLANDLGQEIWVISPYYHRNRKGETDYLAQDGIRWVHNVSVSVGGRDVVLGVHEGRVSNVRVIFLHNEEIFPCPYPDFPPVNAVRFLSVIGKSFLEVLCKNESIPQVIVTNDWATGLIPAYAKHGHFGDTFRSCTFFHIIHNFDPAYEGRIWPPPKEDFAWLHGLPRDLLIDPLWAEPIINPSRCALLNCDNWGTVSRSYRDDLRGVSGGAASPLSALLSRFSSPFATPNGIPISLRRARLAALHVKNHLEAKAALQKKYFGFEKADPSIPIYAFIGRITSQKGVHLILEAAESIIKRYNYRVQILIGGKVGWNEPYAARCGNHMYSLRDRYPWSFWADPNEFFSDGALVNLGADFGLMPSLFEPGGIVQHEFFVAGTPVLAFKTGGLKDTVFDFDLESVTGNGFTFASYNLGDFIFAFERAYRVYQDAGKYTKLRQNAEASVVSCETCAAAWLGEFCRLRRKILVNPAKIKVEKAILPDWNPKANMLSARVKINPIREMVKKMQHKQAALVQTSTDASRIPVRIKYVPPSGRRPRSVAISGSFDDWRVRRPLAWDNSQQAYILTMALAAGTYVYKYIVDGDWICSKEHPTQMDKEGIRNNVLTVTP